MRNKSTLTLAALGLLATSSLALAETARPYVGIGGGLSFLQESDVSTSAGNSSLEFNNPGWAANFNAGIGIMNNLRVEAELAHRYNSVDGSAGDVTADSLMANLYYDIPFRLGAFTPYVGVGLGGARIHVDRVPLGGALGTVDDTDTRLAYQGILGMSAPLTPNLSFTMDYRYLSTFQDVEVRSSTGLGVDGEYDDHTFMVGLRWSFGGAPAAPAPVAQPAAAPAPAPAPAPQPAAVAPLTRSFQVFFDFDRSDITEDARRIINQAADNARRAGGTTRITLTGHADRSGAAQYNMRLSQRRADAVKAELIRLGMPANDIATVARGEADPLVPTADGVREPRNRRVEIVF